MDCKTCNHSICEILGRDCPIDRAKAKKVEADSDIIKALQVQPMTHWFYKMLKESERQ